MGSLRLSRWVAAVLLAVAWTAVRADDASLVYYDVAGHTAAKLRHELDAKGPPDSAGHRFDGQTLWRVNWSYRYAPDGHGCRFTRMSTSLTGTIVLPRWTDADQASSSLVSQWDQYLVALRRHEDGHYAHGVAARDAIQALGESFHIPGDCTEIARIFNGEANALLARYASQDVDYDRDTDHGKNQGATFP